MDVLSSIMGFGLPNQEETHRREFESPRATIEQEPCTYRLEKRSVKGGV
jgi:hypothetical protein